MEDKKGYFGIGAINMKNPVNYGTLFRTALVFRADFIFLIGKRFKKQSSDTGKSYKHMPLYQYDSFEDFYKNMPYGCKLIGVELDDIAEDLFEFEHPKQACYLLGSEDNGIPKKILSRCFTNIKIFGKRSLNVSVAGSIVLYDRLCKNSHKEGK